jgi:3-hydroxy-9,10-secoandrosta-1,3,5(10)-triene-9,17-dione monooxygenase
MKAALKATWDDAPVIPSPEELFDRARTLIPMLRERADASAAVGRVPEETIQTFKDAGFFKILQPCRWGGYEMSPAVFYEVQTILGEGDMAAAWVFGIVGVHNWHLALFDDKAAQDVWGEDDTILVASTYMPVGKITEVEGGFRMSGRWKFSSGSDNAKWVFLGAMLPVPGGNGQLEPGTLLLPIEDYEIIEDSWQVGGLRGTGSKDIVVENAFIPHYRTHRHREGFLCESPGNAINTGPLYRLPFGQVFIRAVNGSAIGALRGLAEQVADYASKRISPFGGSTADNPAAQIAVGEALAAVSEMRAVMRAGYAHLIACAERGKQAPMEDRLIYKYQAAQTTTRAVDLAMKLYRVVGGTGLFTEFPFARMVDDITAARQHQFNQDFAFCANIGAVAMGKENGDFFV